MAGPPSNANLGEFLLDPDEQVFRPRRSAQTESLLWLLGGIGALGIAVLAFIAMAFSRKSGTVPPSAVTTMPILVGIAAITASRTAASAPREVGVGPKGVRVVTNKGTVLHSWSEIAWLSTDQNTMNPRRTLRLFDAKGQTLVQLSDALEGFDVMALAIRERVAARPDDAGTQVALGKARRQAIFTGTAAIVFIALSISVANMTRSELRAAKLYAEKAVPGVAQIERRFLAPNGVTPRLVYRITEAGGRTASRNAEVERPYWDELASATTVPVKYVPGEPAISHLASGEVEDHDSMKTPLVGYGMPAILGLMSLFFLASAVLMWRGWDITLDPTGRPRLKRYGATR